MTRAARKHLPRHPSVQEFLDLFGSLVTSGDGKAIAKLWGTPAYVLGDTMAMPITDPEEVAKFFGGAREEYNQRGITDTRAEIQHETWLTDRIVTVEVRWPYIDADGNVNGDETSTYVLRVDDEGDLRLRCAIMHGANEAK